MKKYSFYTLSILTAVVLYVPLWCRADSVVSSSVSIKASSGGESGEQSAHVRTVINGEVVEDWHSTSSEPIEYAKTITLSDNDVEMQSPEREVDDRSTLEEIIKRLRAIIQIYVMLLQHQ